MIQIGIVIQSTIQMLGSPAWIGIGVIISSIISAIALVNSLPILKKSIGFRLAETLG